MVVYIIVNYSIEVFHDDFVATFYSHILEITFCLHTILFLPMIFIILTRSKRMGHYKWYILNGVIWSYVIEAFTTLWQPVPLFPVFMGYSRGAIGPVLNHYTGFIMLIIFAAIYLNMLINLNFSFLIRYVNSVPLTNRGILLFLKKLDQNPKQIVPLIIFVHVLTYSIIIIPIYTFTLSTPEELAAGVEVEAPVLKSFLNYPGAFGIPYSVLFVIVLRITCYGLLLAGCFGLLLLIIFYRMLGRLEKILSKNTYKNQVMLFQALAIQLIDAFAFIITPFFIVGFCASSRFRYTSYECLVLIYLICFHGIADIVALVYFIRPYRQFAISVIRNVVKLIIANRRQVTDDIPRIHINARMVDAEGFHPSHSNFLTLSIL